MLLHSLLLLILFYAPIFFEENFILIEGQTGVLIEERGEVEVEYSPCSTFKIVLSLIGFEEAILEDEKSPAWNYQDGYDDFLDSWKTVIDPQSWMKSSCFWFSKLLAKQIGTEKIQNYLIAFGYGNKDMSAGVINPAWVNSSLKISPKGQVAFIRKFIQNKLPLSSHSILMTKKLIFLEEFEGWKLFGKTGWSGKDGNNLQIGWFVGWIEKDNSFYPFAYNKRDIELDLTQRIPRVKQLFMKSQVMSKDSELIN